MVVLAAFPGRGANVKGSQLHTLRKSSHTSMMYECNGFHYLTPQADAREGVAEGWLLKQCPYPSLFWEGLLGHTAGGGDTDLSRQVTMMCDCPLGRDGSRTHRDNHHQDVPGINVVQCL